MKLSWQELSEADKAIIKQAATLIRRESEPLMHQSRARRIAYGLWYCGLLLRDGEKEVSK